MTASRDDLPPDPPDDPDRAAILARRKRFIAVAMSGLATGLCAACPCLKMAVPDEEGAREPDPRAPPPSPPEAAPQPETAPVDGANNDAPPTSQQQEMSPEPPRAYVPYRGPRQADPRPCLTIRAPRR